jgi:hypothetical protein
MKRILPLITLLILISLACDITQYIKPPPTEILPTAEVSQTTQATDEPQVEVTFRVQLPPDTPKDQPVVLKTMEEVSGLAFNAQTYEMQPEDNNHYTASIKFQAGSVIKYRYARQGSSVEILEHVSDGRPVRYRMYNATYSGSVDDVISRWTDTQFQSPTGRIQGQITDSTTGQPIPNILIVAGGIQTLSASDGSFLIEGLPPGVHNLVAYAMDGLYHTFQQGAEIAADSTTPAQIFMSPAQVQEVTFIVKVPANTIPAVPIRIAGNLYQLGNTFADLSGGISTIASRMPILALQPDGRYIATLSLPAGADLRYYYTLGDGMWNTELSSSGDPLLRQIVIPNAPATIDNEIQNWVKENSAPISFDVTVPDNTPPSDFISIQFKPVYGWTEPIPMWRLDNNRWGFILNSPLNFVSNLSYRFCRNDQCGSADAIETEGNDNAGLPLQNSSSRQSIVEQVNNWEWLDPNVEAAQITTPEITAKDPGFWAGIELQPLYHPSWSALFPSILENIRRIGSNWVIYSPTWSYTSINPPVLELVAGTDPLWNDLTYELSLANESGVQVALRPAVNFSENPEDWWQSSNRDFSWWQVWFERYRNFALNYADLAASSGAQSLIIGGEWLAPALPNGVLFDKSSSGVPVDAEARWRLLIGEVKTHYGGPLFWSLSYSQAVNDPPPFLDAVDGIYLEWSEPLVAQGQTYNSQAELTKEAGRLFDNGMIPFLARFNKPLILAVAYPSADGAASGCIPAPDGSCLERRLLEQPNPDIPSVQIDLQEQVDLYTAMLSVINQRTWVQGIVSQDYYPPAILRDKSASIHGKPAEELLTYWFTNLFPEEQP